MLDVKVNVEGTSGVGVESLISATAPLSSFNGSRKYQLISNISLFGKGVYTRMSFYTLRGPFSSQGSSLRA